MDTFNNDAASGNDMMAGTEQDVLSNDQMDYAPELNTAQQTEYSGLQGFDFNEYLDEDETAKEVQTEPAQSAPESAVIDPRLLGSLPNAGQQPNDPSNSSIYNDMSMLDPTQGIYNAGDLLVDNTYQPNIVHPFQYQQNPLTDNLLQQNRLRQQLLEQKIEEQKLKQQGILQNPFGLNPTQQDVFPQSPYQPDFPQILDLDLQKPQTINVLQPQFIKQEIQPAEVLDSPTITYLGEAEEYRNEILNSFEEPAVALRIIDQLEYPFTASLQTALEKEAFRLEDLKTAKVLESATETETKPKDGRKKHNNSSKISKRPAKAAKNNRVKNREETLAHASKVYKDIPAKPASWGPINPDTGRPTFEYTKYGELALGQKYTADQVIQYLAYHPLHGKLPTGDPDTKESGLKLWIQYTAADSNLRYPDPKQSNKCRFVDCAREGNGLYKGEPRICFDEQRFPDFPTNPFHNAGYVHLYCMEKLLDFPCLCRDFNVEPDVRKLNEPENRMSVNKTSNKMEKIIGDWIFYNSPYHEYEAPQGNRPDDWAEGALHYAISEHHMNTQPGGAQKTREKRGGNTIDQYKGNLDLWAENHKKQKAYKEAHPELKKRKRKADADKEDEDEDAEGSDDEEILDEEILDRPIKRARRT
jgi:hypothetical protein